MSSLTEQDKNCILEFYFRCGSEEEISHGRDLIAASPEAARLYDRLEFTLTQLDHIKYEPCPDNLVDVTVAKLKVAASASQVRLETLLDTEQKKVGVGATRFDTTKRGFWRVAELAAAAAMIMLVLQAMVFKPAANARQLAWRSDCANNLKQVGAGIANFANEHDGQLPYVDTTQGAPWWKVGDQGTKNQSNTRHIWRLVKDGYVDGKHFVCAGRKDAARAEYKQVDLDKLNDFPSRQHVSYSFMLMCPETVKRQGSGEVTVLMADSNPVFERVFKGNKTVRYDSDKFARVLLDKHIRAMMSLNHKGHGQNILLSGQSAQFRNKRIILDDDIYTVKGVDSYTGSEAPCAPGDGFLVP